MQSEKVDHTVRSGQNSIQISFVRKWAMLKRSTRSVSYCNGSGKMISLKCVKNALLVCSLGSSLLSCCSTILGPVHAFWVKRRRILIAKHCKRSWRSIVGEIGGTSADWDDCSLELWLMNSSEDCFKAGKKEWRIEKTRKTIKCFWIMQRGKERMENNSLIIASEYFFHQCSHRRA